MKKLLFPLFAVAAMVLASCSSDDDDKEPVGTHYYTIDPEDNSLGKADMGHMEKVFPDEQEINFSIEGTKAEADQKAIERYNDILSQIDNDAVCNAFPSYYDEGMQEYLYYAVHLTRTDGGRTDTLKSRYWTIKGIASSPKDDESEPVGTHYYTIATDDMSWGRADMNYVADFFPDNVRMFTIEGTKSGADQEAIKRYNDILSQIDNDAVCNAFPSYYDEGFEEYLYYAVHLTRTEGRPDTLKSRYWTIKGIEDR